MKLREKANEILEKLNENGFEAYLVGGCVRDFLMGEQPSDYDITTSAKPEEIKKLFEKTIDTGIKHGTVTVVLGKFTFEVTTYRTESEYEHNRKPKNVEFVQNLEEDLKRRDFTINAMCIDKSGEVVDLFGGREDIENKIIRAVGDGNIRFEEDALRMLRCIRFASKTGFEIDRKTFSAIKNKASLIKNISSERIKSELDGTLLGKSCTKISLLRETGLEKELFSEKLNFESIEKTNNVNIKWALLLKNFKEPSNVLNKLKFDNKSKSEILTYLKNKDKEIRDNEIFIKNFIFDYKITDFSSFAEFYEINNGVSLKNKDVNPFFVKDLKVNGNDLKELGIEKEKIGTCLKILAKKVINKEIENEKNKLKETAEKL